MQTQVLCPGAFFISQDLEVSVEINMLTITLLEKKIWLNAQERLGIKENSSFFSLADLRQVSKLMCVFFYQGVSSKPNLHLSKDLCQSFLRTLIMFTELFCIREIEMQL